MILADENIHGSIIKTLREAGFEVMSVRELAGGINDEQVIQMALTHDFLVLTEDKDFGEWVFAHHIKNLSVLFLRYSFHEYNDISQTIVQLLNSKTLERPFFVAISTKKVRIRKL